MDKTSRAAELDWYLVNDNVMGGRSVGDFVIDNGLLRFRGRINTNGGGFSSVRTRDWRADLSDAAGIRLRLRADGRRYSWQLRTDARFRGQPIGYWAEFETAQGQWQSIDIPLSRFRPRFRGNALEGPPLDASQVSGMGLMLSDGVDGDFLIELDTITFVDEAESPDASPAP